MNPDFDTLHVHSDYETRMVTSRRKQIITGLESRLKNADPMPLITGHREAGQAVVALMDRTVKRIDPAYLCQVWVDTDGHVAPMWDTLGKKTLDCIADGCKTLAMLWSSAWRESGTAIPSAQPIDRKALNKLYRTEDFARSLYLTEYAQRSIW